MGNRAGSQGQRVGEECVTTGDCDSLSVIPRDRTQVTQVGAHSVLGSFPSWGSIWGESEGGGEEGGGGVYSCVNGYGEGAKHKDLNLHLKRWEPFPQDILDSRLI